MTYTQKYRCIWLSIRFSSCRIENTVAGHCKWRTLWHTAQDVPRRSLLLIVISFHGMGRDSSVGIATRYGLDGPGNESRWVWDFPHLSSPLLVPIQPPIIWVPGLLPGGKAAGAWRWPPIPSSAEVKERVEIYRGADRSLTRPTSRYIVFDVRNVSFDANLVIYRVSQEERTKLREGVPYVKLYRCNPEHLCPKFPR